MRAAGSGIPGRSVDDVRQHDEWYSEYLILKDSKKKAIQEWKDIKEVEWFLYEQLVLVLYQTKQMAIAEKGVKQVNLYLTVWACKARVPAT